LTTTATGPLGLAANLARGLTGGEVGVAAEERGDIYVMSLSSRKMDLNQFLRGFAKRYGVSGGGHPNAAGARMPKLLLKTLVEELNRLAGGP
jgi:single-stranded-DNA-specific exonuclease